MSVETSQAFCMAINPFQWLKEGDKFDTVVLKGKVGFSKNCMILRRIGLVLKLLEIHSFCRKMQHQNRSICLFSKKLLRHRDVTTDMSSRTGKSNHKLSSPAVFALGQAVQNL